MRNTYDFDCDEETSFWYVIKDSFGGIEELPSRVRSQVRRSLRTYDVVKVSPDDMLKCIDLYNKANRGYRIKAQEISLESFRKRIFTQPSIGHYEFWQVVSKETGDIVAFSINTVHDSHCDYSTLKADPDVMKGSTYPFYGLIYTMNQYYLEEVGLKYVNDGARSITNHSNIQPFLIEKFRFRKAYCRLTLYYNWWFGLAVKCLYPFRNLIKSHRISAILNQEAMARGDV